MTRQLQEKEKIRQESQDSLLKIRNEVEQLKRDKEQLKEMSQDEVQMVRTEYNKISEKYLMLDKHTAGLSSTISQLQQSLMDQTQKTDVTTQDAIQLAADIQRQNNRIKQLENQLQSCQKEINQSKEELYAFKRKEADLLSQIESLKMDNQKKASSFSEEKKDRKRLLEENESLRNEIERLSVLVDEKERQTQNLLSENARVKERMENQNGLIEKLQTALANRSAAVDEHESSQRDNLEKLIELQSKVQSYVQEVEELTSDKEEVEQKYQTACEELHSLTTSTLPSLSSTISHLRSELALKQQENAELNAFTYRLESEIKETASTIKQLELELQQKLDYEAKSMQEQHENELLNMKTLQKSAEQEVDRIKRQCNELDLKNGYLEDTVARLKTELQDNKQSFEKREQEIRKGIEEAKKEASKQIKTLSDSADHKENELVQLATFCKSLQTELLSLRNASRNNKNLFTENIELQGEASQLQSRLEACEEQFEEFRRDVEWKEDKLAEEKSMIEKELALKNKELERLQEKNEQLKCKMAVAYAEIEKLTLSNHQSQNSSFHHNAHFASTKSGASGATASTHQGYTKITRK